MIDKRQEAELFDYLMRQKRFREWLEDQLQSQYRVLVVNPDVEQLRMAQGRAQFIQSMLDRLTAAESTANRQ